MVWTGNTFSDKGQCVVQAVLLSRNQSPCCRTLTDTLESGAWALTCSAREGRWARRTCLGHASAQHPWCHLRPCHRYPYAALPSPSLLHLPLLPSCFPLPAALPGSRLPVPLLLRPIADWLLPTASPSGFFPTPPGPSPRSACAPRPPHALLVLH